MRGGVGVGVLLVAGAALAAGPAARVYVVVTVRPAGLAPDSWELRDQFELQLREGLRRTGATVLDQQDPRVVAIILRPRLEVLPSGLNLNLVGVRSGDEKLLGSIWVRAGGATRAAQLRAIVRHACFEAAQFE